MLCLMSDTALKVHSLRLGDDDLANVGTLTLGDETLSQTIRRTLREAAQRARASGGKASAPATRQPRRATRCR